MLGPTEEGEGDSLEVRTFRVPMSHGAVVAASEHGVTVYGLDMSDDDALALVIAYAKAATHTKGMTRQ